MNHFILSKSNYQKGKIPLFDLLDNGSPLKPPNFKVLEKSMLFI